jgi:hypothetical protein
MQLCICSQKAQSNLPFLIPFITLPLSLPITSIKNHALSPLSISEIHYLSPPLSRSHLTLSGSYFLTFSFLLLLSLFFFCLPLFWFFSVTLSPPFSLFYLPLSIFYISLSLLYIILFSLFFCPPSLSFSSFSLSFISLRKCNSIVWCSPPNPSAQHQTSFSTSFSISWQERCSLSSNIFLRLYCSSRIG